MTPLRQAVHDYLALRRAIGFKLRANEDALADIKKAGKTEIVSLTPEQDAAMRKALEPVYHDVAKRVGQPLIDEFLKETGAAGH